MTEDSRVDAAQPSATSSSTVDRSVALLLMLVENPNGLGITELTRRLKTQRAPLYRIISSLQKHQLVHRDEHKRYRIGAGTLQLARAYMAQFPNNVEALLSDLADEIGITASLISCDGDVLTTVYAVPPRTGREHVLTPVGFKHPDLPVSPRVVLLASRRPSESDTAEVKEARRLGYAIGRGNVLSNVHGMATMIPGTENSKQPLVLGVSTMRPNDTEKIAALVLRTAELIGVTVERDAGVF